MRPVNLSLAPRVCGLAALLVAGPAAFPAAAMTNIIVANVTPAGFTLLCQDTAPAPSLAVFADISGLTNLAGQVGVEADPLHTGNPALAAGYERRQDWKRIRDKTHALGFASWRVTGCEPDTAYYYRLTSRAGGASYPPAPPLPAVVTPRENSWITNAQQLVVEVPGTDTEGCIVTLSHSNAAYALAAVVGDGANTNQAWFNLADLFGLAGAGNFTPLGPQEFTVTLLGGPGQTNLTQAFALNISPDFQVGSASLGVLGIEYFAIYLGSTILRAGETSAVPITINCNVQVTEISANLGLATDRLTNFALADLPPAVQTATLTPQSPTNALLLIRAADGQSLQGQMTLASLRFSAVSNQSSAFLPLDWLALNVTKSGNVSVQDVFAQDGRVVVVGREPLLEISTGPDGKPRLTLYGNPWSAYGVEYSTDAGVHWAAYLRLPLTNLFLTFKGLTTGASVFYRASELPGDPPALEARRTGDQTRALTVYGQPGGQYTVQYATNLSEVVTWRPLLTYTLTNAFKYIDGLTHPSPIIFLRLQRN